MIGTVESAIGRLEIGIEHATPAMTESEIVVEIEILLETGLVIMYSVKRCVLGSDFNSPGKFETPPFCG